MDTAKNYPAIFVLIITLVSMAVGPAGASTPLDSTWTSLTSLGDVRRIVVIGDTLYAATSGGILAVAAGGGEPDTYLNTDGLGTVNISDIASDAEGRLWVTGAGRLVLFDGALSERYLVFDEDENLAMLHCVADDGDKLWVGSNLALLLYEKDDGGAEYKDYYDLYGNLNPAPAVFDILVDGDSIWLATAAGLAVADKSNPILLKARDHWTTFGLGEYPELGTDTVRRVVSFEGDIYLGTANGLFRLDRTPIDTFLTMLTVGQNELIGDVIVSGDTMFFYSPDGVGVLTGGSASVLPLAGLSGTPMTGASFDGERWVATTDGIYHGSDDALAMYPHTGAPSNDVSGIAIGAEGYLTAGFNRNRPGQYIDGEWLARDFFVQDGVVSADAGPYGSAWLGTFGNGLWLLTDEGEVNFDEQNSSLRGNNDAGGEDYIVVRGIAVDGNYVYAAAFRALNGYPVAVGDLRSLSSVSSWDSLGTTDGIMDAFVSCLDARGGYVAVGTEQNGIYFCYVGPDPFDKRDDYCIHYTEDSFYLLSDVIRIVKFSPHGELWAGTNFGLSRYDIGIDRFVDVSLPPGFGPDIRALDFDGRGNVWVGSANGLVRLDSKTGEAIHYTTLNSDLVGDNVRALAWDDATARLFVGTSSGITVIPSEIGRPVETVEEVYAFPNPFVIRSTNDRVAFNFAERFSMRIFTVAGELVCDTRQHEWDGRNDDGQPVASGVYLYVLTDDDGNVGTGKLLLIRE